MMGDFVFSSPDGQIFTANESDKIDAKIKELNTKIVPEIFKPKYAKGQKYDVDDEYKMIIVETPQNQNETTWYYGNFYVRDRLY